MQYLTREVSITCMTLTIWEISRTACQVTCEQTDNMMTALQWPQGSEQSMIR